MPEEGETSEILFLVLLFLLSVCEVKKEKKTLCNITTRVRASGNTQMSQHTNHAAGHTLRTQYLTALKREYFLKRTHSMYERDRPLSHR